MSSAVTTTGRYTYTLTVTMNYGTPITRSVSGALFVIAEDASPYGAGVTLASVDKLYSITASSPYPAGMLREYGDGGASFYADNGAGGYTSPAGDPGTLTKATTAGGVTTYLYSGVTGDVRTFNSSGLMTRWQSADGAATVTNTFSSGKLSTVALPDSALATLSYDPVTGRRSGLTGVQTQTHGEVSAPRPHQGSWPRRRSGRRNVPS